MNASKVLIVDDNPANLKLACVLLEGDGFLVRTATSAEDTLAKLATFTPDLILMDIQLPDIDGLELTRRLKRDPKTRGIMVIALTAYAMKGDDVKAREAGCDGYITKPIDTRTLTQVLTKHLANRATRDASGRGGGS